MCINITLYKAMTCSALPSMHFHTFLRYYEAILNSLISHLTVLVLYLPPHQILICFMSRTSLVPLILISSGSLTTEKLFINCHHDINNIVDSTIDTIDLLDVTYISRLDHFNLRFRIYCSFASSKRVAPL